MEKESRIEPSIYSFLLSNMFSRCVNLRKNIKLPQPWFLDGKITSNFRGRPHIDGSFLSKEDDYRPNIERHSDKAIDILVLDWSKDPEMSSKGGIDIVEALSPKGIYGLMEQGKLYGKVMEDQGMFSSLKKLQ